MVQYNNVLISFFINDIFPLGSGMPGCNARITDRWALSDSLSAKGKVKNEARRRLLLNKTETLCETAKSCV